MNFYIAVSFFLCSHLFAFADNNIVTYKKGEGRFGDQLLTYLHAKWFAYKNGCTLVYRPFSYSSFLLLDEKEVHYKNKELRKQLGLNPLFKTQTYQKSFFSKIPWIGLHYKCPYFGESSFERREFKNVFFQVDWKDEKFRQIVKELIAPKKELLLTKPLPHSISIAIHVREGGGFDADHTRLSVPFKLPPLNFYTQGLNHILSLLPNKTVHCHLFTDAREPEKIVEEMKKAIPPNVMIHFTYREKDNHHELNVLEDFFSLFHFDILIRSESNFSIIPSLLHDYAIVYSPKAFHVENNKPKITEITIHINEELYRRLHTLPPQ